MLLHESVRFRRDGQLPVSDDAMWKFGDAGQSEQTRKVALGVTTACRGHWCNVNVIDFFSACRSLSESLASDDLIVLDMRKGMCVVANR